MREKVSANRLPLFWVSSLALIYLLSILWNIFFHLVKVDSFVFFWGWRLVAAVVLASILSIVFQKSFRPKLHQYFYQQERKVDELFIKYDGPSVELMKYLEERLEDSIHHQSERSKKMIDNPVVKRKLELADVYLAMREYTKAETIIMSIDRTKLASNEVFAPLQYLLLTYIYVRLTLDIKLKNDYAAANTFSFAISHLKRLSKNKAFRDYVSLIYGLYSNFCKDYTKAMAWLSTIQNTGKDMRISRRQNCLMAEAMIGLGRTEDARKLLEMMEKETNNEYMRAYVDELLTNCARFE